MRTSAARRNAPDGHYAHPPLDAMHRMDTTRIRRSTQCTGWTLRASAARRNAPDGYYAHPPLDAMRRMDITRNRRSTQCTGWILRASAARHRIPDERKNAKIHLFLRNNLL